MSDAVAVRRPGSAPRFSLAKYGFLIAFAVMIVLFGVARPSTFLTWDNLTSILTQAAPALVIAVGVTVVMVMKDFDLSFASLINLAIGVSVVLMARHGVPVVVAIVATLAAGLVVGAVNGYLVAYLNGPSFVITLAVGTVLTGLEYALTEQQTIFDGVPAEFVAIGQRSFAGLSILVWIAVAFCLAVAFLMEKTEAGRYMYATGGNPEAARLAGVRIRAVRMSGFVLLGVGAALVGVMLAAQSSAYTPGMGAAYLLPAYAAVFLGTAAFRPGEFTVAGTVLGVLFLGVVQTGLTMLSLPTYAINLVQGCVLVVAVLVSRLERSQRRAGHV